ncbi:MAG TPA: hypothetical protein VFP71_01185 [Candidatus Angelobacter sp.]|nr:hypothetical protein [Candidatus Angelobacter sp.]
MKLGNLAVNYPTSCVLQVAKQSLRALSVEQGDSNALQEVNVVRFANARNPFACNGSQHFLNSSALPLPVRIATASALNRRRFGVGCQVFCDSLAAQLVYLG